MPGMRWSTIIYRATRMSKVPKGVASTLHWALHCMREHLQYEDEWSEEEITAAAIRYRTADDWITDNTEESNATETVPDRRDP